MVVGATMSQWEPGFDRLSLECVSYSKKKPFCDDSHKEVGFGDEKC